MPGSIKKRVIGQFVAGIAIIATVMALVGVLFGSWYTQTRVATDAVCTAKTVAILFEQLNAAGSVPDVSSEEYRESREAFREICKDNEFAYLYVYECTAERDQITFLMCVASDDAEDARMQTERSPGVVVEHELSEQERRVLAGDDIREPFELNNEFGHVYAYYAKADIPGRNVIVGVEYTVSEVERQIAGVVAALIAGVVAALSLLLVFELHILERRAFAPLRKIAGRMKAFAQDRTRLQDPLDIPPSDEMDQIVGAFEGMAADIDEYLDDIERMTTERVQTSVEAQVARRIQLGMVPERLCMEAPGFSISACARPARLIGGDFYDCLELEDGRIALVVGDVSGKGVAAALFMAMAKTTIRDLLVQGANPAHALNDANKRLCSANPENMFVTVFACIIDTATGVARFANAGHNPPLLVGRESTWLEMPPGDLLGVFDDVELEEGSFTLEPGEGLLAYTDGATEAVNEAREFLGEGRLKEGIDACLPADDAQMLLDAAIEAVDSFVSGSEQFDDLTLVAFMRLASLSGELAVDMPAFAAMKEDILSCGLDDEVTMRACLAAEEAFANVVAHSGATWARYSVAVHDGLLDVVLEDDGTAFDQTVDPGAGKPFDELDSGGMGLPIIRGSAQRLSYRREGCRNILQMGFLPSS